MPVTREEVTHRWPALDGVKNADEWATALADAAAQVDPGTWGARATLGQIHLAAHLLALGHPELRDSGLVSSESVGDVSRSYAVAPLPSGFSFDATPYGREYLRLSRQLGNRILVP